MTQLHERVPEGAGALCSCGAIWPCPNASAAELEQANPAAGERVILDELRRGMAELGHDDAVMMFADTIRALVDEGPLAGRLRVLVFNLDDESSSGAEAIAVERYRQIAAVGELGEGYDAEHDDAHQGGDLLRAALTYATLGLAQVDAVNGWDAPTLARIIFEDLWPWDESECNLSDDPVRNLVRAGALIAAELDRLDRLGPEAIEALGRYVPTVEQILAVDDDPPVPVEFIGDGWVAEIPGGDL